MYHALTTRKTHTDMKLVCVGPGGEDRRLPHHRCRRRRNAAGLRGGDSHGRDQARFRRHRGDPSDQRRRTRDHALGSFAGARRAAPAPRAPARCSAGCRATRRNDSAACSTSMPQPLVVRRAWSDCAHMRERRVAAAVGHVVADGFLVDQSGRHFRHFALQARRGGVDDEIVRRTLQLARRSSRRFFPCRRTRPPDCAPSSGVRLAMVSVRSSRSISGAITPRAAPPAPSINTRLSARSTCRLRSRSQIRPMPSVLSPSSVVSSKKAMVFTACARAARGVNSFTNSAAACLCGTVTLSPRTPLVNKPQASRAGNRRERCRTADRRGSAPWPWRTSRE